MTNANPTTPGQQIPGGFGSPRISTHLHNGHTASESDGNPADIYPPNPVPAYLPQYPESIRNLIFRDHHYAMFRAGLDPRVPADIPGPNKNDGDIAETVSTLWYHDHSMDHTAENVYKGLVGFHLFFDEIDSGNENDPAPRALRLPSGEFDIPLLFQDKRFDANGQLFLPRLDSDPPPMLGVLGDRFTVNGQIQPKLTVLRRKYRFRLLNAGPSRFYQFFLTKDGKDQAFIQIGNDESLLEKPYDIPPNEGVLMAVAERADVVIDFSRYTKGDKLFLVNRLVMHDEGFGPVIEAGKYKILPEGEGDHILCFEVVMMPWTRARYQTICGKILISLISPSCPRKNSKNFSIIESLDSELTKPLAHGLSMGDHLISHPRGILLPVSALGLSTRPGAACRAKRFMMERFGPSRIVWDHLVNPVQIGLTQFTFIWKSFGFSIGTEKPLPPLSRRRRTC